MSLTISHDYHTKVDPFPMLVLCLLLLQWQLCMIQQRNTLRRVCLNRRGSKKIVVIADEKRSRWNSFLRASKRHKLIAIQPAIKIAMYSIISIVAKFSHSSEYFHVNSFASHYSVCSLHLLGISTTSDASTLWKFTLCNT